MKSLSILALMATLIISCSSDNGPEPGCYQESERRIVAVVSDVRGFISQECFDLYLIDPVPILENNPIGILSPCNLMEEFKEDGIDIIFSGYIYESFEFEDICADFFEITEIRLANP